MGRRCTAWLVVLCLARLGGAAVLGGGLARTDCNLGFEGVDANAGASGVVCHDGDPACDTDGAADGTCHFEVRLCTHLESAACMPLGVTGVAVAGLALGVPPLPTPDHACGAPFDAAVTVGTAQGATASARVQGALKDVDYLNLCCRGAPGHALDAAACAAGVTPAVAGCAAGVLSKAAFRAFTKAHDLIDHAIRDPGHARRDRQLAARALRRAQTIGQRLGKRDVCGYDLALVAGHALEVLAAAAP